MRTPDRSQRESVTLSFSGHETFVFRYGWLKKAVDAVISAPDVFSSGDAMTILGVGKNMVRSIRHWALATGVVKEEPHTRRARLKPTHLGMQIFREADPYLEEISSLWLLHWKLATNERQSTTWCWAFSLPNSVELTRDALAGLIRDEAQRRNAKLPTDNSLRRDIDCFVRTYCPARHSAGSLPEESLDCPLIELGLMERAHSAEILRFRRGPQPSLPDEIFAYALVDFWERAASGRESLTYSEIAYGMGSPGRVFKLDEDSLTERLDRLEVVTSGSLSYAETAGLKQVYKRGEVQPTALLERRYAETAPRIGACFP